jgi:hypothetical protein
MAGNGFYVMRPKHTTDQLQVVGQSAWQKGRQPVVGCRNNPPQNVRMACWIVRPFQQESAPFQQGGRGERLPLSELTGLGQTHWDRHRPS